MTARELTIAKITRPRAEGILPRKRLFRLLDEGRVCPVVWVSGPPGSGKTSLVASYLDARKVPCLWYQIDEGDADLATFFYYLGMAGKKAAPRKRKPLPFLKSEYLAGLPAFTRRYFEDLFSRLTPAPSSRGKSGNGGFAVVFDNYQNVPLHSGFHDMIVHGLEAVPEGVNVFILSRNEPPPQLARLTANDKIHFLGWEEIRFTLEETREVFRASGQKKETNDILPELHEKTEGWAAGLVLILLGLRVRKSYDRPLKRFPTKQVFDYFASEIFEKTEKETRDFLVITAFFPRMTVPMAEKLTRLRTSRQILSALSGDHYFTETYSQDNPVYQYHPLFREFLLAKGETYLNPVEVPLIRQKAAVLLEEAGRMEDAAALFRDAGDWSGLTRLITNQAKSLIGQGRNRTVEDWIKSIPEDIRNRNPWLLYWLGFCRQPFDPAESRRFFEEAFRLFEEQGDGTGTLLAWSGAVDAIVFEWNDFTLLDRWIEWLDRSGQPNGSFPSSEVEARVASSMAVALLYRHPDRPDIRKWMERSLSASREAGDLNLRLQACLNAVNYCAWTGDLASCSMMADEIRQMAQSPTASPLLVLTWKWIEALNANRTAGASEVALKSISEGLEIARKNGVHVWDHVFYSQAVYASLNKGDMALAGEHLKSMEALLDRTRRHSLCQFHYLSAWHDLLVGDIFRASISAETALKIADETGMVFTRSQCSLLMAQVLYEKGEYRKAAGQLSLAKDLVRRSGSPMLEYLCLIKEAQFALDRAAGEPEAQRGDLERHGVEALRRSMRLGKEHGYVNLFPWWQPSAVARLCVKALAAGIETDYVRGLIRSHGLVPDHPPFDIEGWPWPLKIYTLGKFELIREDRPFQFSKKVQKKPLQILKALIAQGNRSIKMEQLADLLWPDADGDLAIIAFKTTLSRLRQLIGNEKAIEVLEGRVVLDPRICWVDAWAFEKMFGELEPLLDGDLAEDQVEGTLKLAEKALAVYKGPFLPAEEEESWGASYGERLRGKFLRFILRLGDLLQGMGQEEKAVECYQKAFDADGLAEEICQRLMVGLQKLGRRSEAIAAYRRCRSTLASSLGIDPSPRTETIYRSLTPEIRRT